MQVNRGFAFWGVALITAGAVALAIQTELIPAESARQAWRLWPLVLIIIGLSASFAWVLTIEGLPQKLAGWMVAQDFSPVMFLIVVNIFLLLFGIFIEPLPGVMVLVPILAPVAIKLGVDPVHFGVIVVFNTTIASISPPVGTVIYTVCSITKCSIEDLTIEMLPFMLTLIAFLFILTFCPPLVTFLPNLLF